MLCVCFNICKYYAHSITVFFEVRFYHVNISPIVDIRFTSNFRYIEYC